MNGAQFNRVNTYYIREGHTLILLAFKRVYKIELDVDTTGTEKESIERARTLSQISVRKTLLT
jgi:hypothetical protein